PAQLLANRTLQYHSDTPTSVHLNFEVQRQLASSLSVRLGYVGSYAWHNTRQTQEDTRIPTILPDGTELFAANGPLINPNFSDIQGVRTDARSKYNGLQAQLQKTLSFGLTFQ